MALLAGLAPACARRLGGPTAPALGAAPAAAPAAEDRAARAAELLARAGDRLENDDPRAAIPDLVLAVELAPDRAEAHFALGLAYFRTDDHARARPELETALEREPEHAGALEYLGRIEYAEGRMDRAIERFRAALAAEPGRPGVKELLEKAEREGRVEAAFTERFTAHFHMKLEGGSAEAAIADRVEAALERAYGDVGAALGQYPQRAVPVILYADREFYAVTGSHGWVGGLFDGKIRIPVKDLFHRDEEALRRVATHEYTHACVYTLAPRCPTWLQEGLAQHFEGLHPDEAGLGAARGGLAPIASLSETFVTIRDPEAARLVYGQSQSFVEFLIARKGVGELAAVLRALGEGKTLDDALERTYGEATADLDAEWRAQLR
jgi:tetratricopeptide (TPR) repeat protein